MSFKEYLKKVTPYVLLILLVLAIVKIFHINPLSYWW